jgi:hypothetical protein
LADNNLEKLERELIQAEKKMEEALEAQAEAEYKYSSWSKEKANIMKAIDKEKQRR